MTLRPKGNDMTHLDPREQKRLRMIPPCFKHNKIRVMHLLIMSSTNGGSAGIPRGYRHFSSYLFVNSLYPGDVIFITYLLLWLQNLVSKNVEWPQVRAKFYVQ